MKFENSVFEDRYNEYWNKQVVSIDATIRNISIGLSFFKYRDIVPQLINDYGQNVLNILSNLDRQSYLFEDKAYVQEYMKNTIQQTVEDFSSYSKIFPESQEICSEFLKKLGVESPSEKEDLTFTAVK